MWNISEVKQTGKMAFKANYWRCVFVAFVLSAITASGGAVATGGDGNATFDNVKDAINSSATQLGVTPAFIVGAVAAILGVGALLSFVIGFFVTNPLEVGCRNFFLKNLNDRAVVREIGDGFKVSYIRNAVAMLLVSIFIVIGVFLFIIPGIIMIYSFRMVPYILMDYPEASPMEAINMSREMMRGNKFKSFLLDLSFIGWYILGAITLGLVYIFYAQPYISSTDAALYETLRRQ